MQPKTSNENSRELILVEGLEEAKRISNDIAEKMAKAKIVQANIQITSEKYRSVAARAALLFFLMNAEKNVNKEYYFCIKNLKDLT